MRRIAMVGDLHGNWPATQAMGEALRRLKPDETWFLGDAVGKGPSSRETCDWARENCTLFVGGNWDYGIGGREFAGDHYYWNQLGEERMAWLNGLPREAEVTLGGIRFRLFHGRPVTQLLRVTSPREELEAAFETERGSFGGIIFADSHRPFLRTLSKGYALNTGSVGNSMGMPRAHALLVEEDGDLLSFQILSLKYDNERAAADARADADMPHREEYIHEILTGIYSR